MDTTRYRNKTLKEAARILREADREDWAEFFSMVAEDPDNCHYCNLSTIGKIQAMLGCQVIALTAKIHPKNNQPDNGNDPVN